MAGSATTHEGALGITAFPCGNNQLHNSVEGPLTLDPPLPKAGPDDPGVRIWRAGSCWHCGSAEVTTRPSRARQGTAGVDPKKSSR
jgi:hypothetical protein